jgi:NADPH:quinone reductase-like Zn-dependent oxidoreductase
VDTIKAVEKPAPKIVHDHDVLVDVKACSLNYRDLMVAQGVYSPGTFPPFIPLSDMAGVVREVGSKVTTLKPGDRVLNAPFKHWPGGMLREEWASTFIGGRGVDGVLAEQIIYPSDALVKIPAHLDFSEAATFTIAGLTAWSAIVTHGKTRPGEWVLLQGTGGVSIFAAQLAQAMGARVVMTTSSREKGEFVKKNYGVHATVDYREKDWHKLVREATQGEGVDVVVDVAGGEALALSLKACNFGARVAVVGVLSNTETTIQIRDLLYRQIQLRGIFMESTEELRAFMRAVDVLKLKPHIDKVFAFDQVHDAYKHLEAQKHVGKIVIKL